MYVTGSASDVYVVDMAPFPGSFCNMERCVRQRLRREVSSTCLQHICKQGILQALACCAIPTAALQEPTAYYDSTSLQIVAQHAKQLQAASSWLLSGKQCADFHSRVFLSTDAVLTI